MKKWWKDVRLSRKQQQVTSVDGDVFFFLNFWAKQFHYLIIPLLLTTTFFIDLLSPPHNLIITLSNLTLDLLPSFISLSFWHQWRPLWVSRMSSVYLRTWWWATRRACVPWLTPTPFWRSHSASNSIKSLTWSVLFHKLH